MFIITLGDIISLIIIAIFVLYIIGYGLYIVIKDKIQKIKDKKQFKNKE